MGLFFDWVVSLFLFVSFFLIVGILYLGKSGLFLFMVVLVFRELFLVLICCSKLVIVFGMIGMSYWVVIVNLFRIVWRMVLVRFGFVLIILKGVVLFMYLLSWWINVMYFFMVRCVLYVSSWLVIWFGRLLIRVRTLLFFLGVMGVVDGIYLLKCFFIMFRVWLSRFFKLLVSFVLFWIMRVFLLNELFVFSDMFWIKK